MINYAPYSTLPYFVDASGSRVWFNEHYGNKIALLDPTLGTLTEFSEANPPVTNATKIHDDLTVAATETGLWFTSTTADYIGFVDGSYALPFSMGVAGSNQLTIAPGSSAIVQFQVSGTWGRALTVKVSDSENITSVPNRMSIQPESSSIPAGSGRVYLRVTVTAAGSLTPGRYTIAVTVTDGLVYQTAYVFATVT